MKLIIQLIVLLLLAACGNKSESHRFDNEDDSVEYGDLERSAFKSGYNRGMDDVKAGKPYLASCTPQKSVYHMVGNNKQKETWEMAYRKGYDEGYNEGFIENNQELTNAEDPRQEAEDYEYSEITVTTHSTPNSYSSPNVSSGTFHSEEGIYGDFYNYEETSDCVEGVVVYEGKSDYYIVETRKGYTLLERYSGRLYEGDKVRGELNKYNYKYLINRNNDSEVKVYIVNYMLSVDRALEWLGEHEKLKSDDQEAYDANNE